MLNKYTLTFVCFPTLILGSSLYMNGHNLFSIQSLCMFTIGIVCSIWMCILYKTGES